MKKILFGLFTLSTLSFSQFIKDSEGVIKYSNENGVSCYYVNDELAHMKDYNLWVEMPNWDKSGTDIIRCFDDNCEAKEEFETTGIFNEHMNIHMLKVTPEILKLLQTHEGVFISNYRKNRGLYVKLKDFNKLYNEVIVKK